MQKSLNKTEKHQPVTTLHVPRKIKFIHFWRGIKAYVISALQLTCTEVNMTYQIMVHCQ